MLDELICSVCGEKSLVFSFSGSNGFGAPGLDTRPHGMIRNTLDMTVQECPNCGYVSTRLDDTTSVDMGFLKSEQYLQTDGIKFMSTRATQFYKYYLIKLKEKDTTGSLYGALHAAWACDDVNDSHDHP